MALCRVTTLGKALDFDEFPVAYNPTHNSFRKVAGDSQK
jgi:hypothetical protein